MKHFNKLADYDVAPVMAQLDARPDLWDARRDRTKAHTFRQTSDIWVRYRPLAELTEPKKFAEPHFATWYPAWHALPALRPIVFSLMAKTEAVYLGGILITRIPAGGSIEPHHDRGSWHAEYLNTKVYVPLRANERCINRCLDEQIVISPGEAVSFNNLVTHSVHNNGDTERVTLIVCLRCE